jgi:uncharacterized membrane protein
MLNEFHKKIIIFAGLLFLLGNNIVLYLTFLAAFFNDGKQLIVVNQYNEHWVEFFALPIITILGIIATVYAYKNIPQLKRKRILCKSDQ